MYFGPPPPPTRRPPPSQHVGLRLLNQDGRQFVRRIHCLTAHIPIWTNIAADYITWEARRQKMGGEGMGERGRGRGKEEGGGAHGSPLAEDNEQLAKKKKN